MRPKSILLLALALGCGLIASWGISDVMERNANREQAPVEETEEIYVALKDINVNEALNPELVKLETWPKVKVPRDAMRELEELVGRRAGTKLYAGEPIIASRLVSANQGAADQLPKGYRPFPIRVDAVTSAAGLIKPGDRVDVQLFVKRNPALGIEETRTQTILSDIRVFAIDNQFRRNSNDEEETHALASTVSLVVTVEQANKLSLASRIGEMSLMLRHPDDDEIAEDSASVNELFGLESGDREAERETPAATAADDILAKLNAMKNAAAQSIEPVVEVIETPPHKLMLLRGSEVEVIEFPIDGSLPTTSTTTKATTSPTLRVPSNSSINLNPPSTQSPINIPTATSDDDSSEPPLRETNGDDAPSVDLDDLSNLNLGLE